MKAGALAEGDVGTVPAGRGREVKAVSVERGRKTGALAERDDVYVSVPQSVPTRTAAVGEISRANFSITSVFLVSCSCRTAISLASSCASALIFLRSLRPSICLDCHGRW